jgi:hypothetical protein
MLYRVLHELAAGNSRNVAEIARSLGISPLMAARIIDDLSRLGYLEANVSDCSSQACSCGGCPASAACKEPDRFWFITKKGQTLLKNQASN